VNPPLIAASVICTDFARLGEEVARLEAAGVEWLHFDSMDANFVPPLTYGPLVLKALRRLSHQVFNAHLMVAHPEPLIAEYAASGADGILVHRETVADPAAVLEQIRAAGCQAGLAYNPLTPLDDLAQWLPHLDLLIVMSVTPGWSGQKFMPVALDKIRQARELLDAQGSSAKIIVDGGLNGETTPLVTAAGADVAVSGSFLMEHPGGLAAALKELRTLPA
jgi:ribulose-phosphate 3-epimerase